MEEMFSKIYMFYRLFPNEPISIKEFLKFAYDSISKKDIIYIILAGFIGGLLSTSVPIATGLLFNNIIPEGNKFSLTGLGLVLLSITISSVLFKYIQFLSMLRIDGKVNYGLQGALWNRLLSLPIPFFGNFNPFELTIKVLGVESIKTVLTISALSSIMAIFFVLFNGILLAYYDVHLALIVYVLALVSSIFTLYFGLQEIKMNRKIIESTDTCKMNRIGIISFLGSLTMQKNLLRNHQVQGPSSTLWTSHRDLWFFAC
jgi:ATP-binding cassette subfamily C protein